MTMNGRKYYEKLLSISAITASLVGLSAASATCSERINPGYLGVAHQLIGFVAAPAAAVVWATGNWSNEADQKAAKPAVQRVSAAATLADRSSPQRMLPEPSAVFRSVAFTANSIPAARKWKEVFPTIVHSDFKHCDKQSDCSARSILQKAIENSADANFRQKLQGINTTVNRLVHYQPDAQNYSAKDYWASPDEILARGKGDCEDYAILKMAALKATGLPAQAMSIVVLRDTRRNLFHAVLAVTTSKGHFILDNLSDRVKLDRDLPDYQPLFSVSAERAWIHGVKVGGEKIASAQPPLSDVMPGEGISLQ
ncbi:transglutaminase-like cysteine peptidase [Pararhizobium sp. YC-54]|uniref:transglutaminase-like cysteine peptidase n=1 Tax=Pararhizobium sp. YC-54 TaxID=2986920 RepID=UPI0021F6A0FC|nr:transglutaminase-like cysteine peptidase [Pararhizobium sp. YC-54]MCW0002328.1 transglutaminase-like cysteine peptidase [Pararhizobium sp. YC-54]